MTRKEKALLFAGFVLLALTASVVWLCGWHMDHIRAVLVLWRAGPVPELSADDRTELHTWLQANTIQLDSIDTGSGFEDMQPLKAMIGDARIVALGEAAHLNGDFYRVKHRLVEFLVSEMDFTVVAIEGPFAGALELNDYLLTGRGDPERALAALVYTAWNTEELLAMVKWMQQYNTTHEKKITFYGFDNKPAVGSARAVHNYLKQTNGVKDYDALLSTLANPWTASGLYNGPRQEVTSAAERIKELTVYLETLQPAHAGDDPSEEQIRDDKQRQLAVQHAKVLLQHIEFREAESISTASYLRDQAMARNVSWLADYEEGAKIVLWAANAHITTTPGSGAMGDYLRRQYGNDLVSIGLLCNRTFSPDPNAQEPTEEAGPSGRGSGTAEAVLASAGLQTAVLDLRSLPKGIVSEYFSARLRGDGGATVVLPAAYDAVLFIESTLTARVLVPIQWVAPARIDAPANLDFEELEDAKPKHWQSRSGQGLVEYQITGSHDQPYEGDTCGMIQRRPGKPFGEVLMDLYQSIKATDFSGQDMRFSATARVDSGNAYLWLSIDVRQCPSIFLHREVTSDQWQQYQIDAEVPKEAYKITYGLAYVGYDAACIDDVSIRQVN
jgi:erythromycin esterase